MTLKKQLNVAFIVITFVFSLTWLEKAQADDFLKISDLNYKTWISAKPVSLIPDFEKSCRAVEVYLNSQNKEFYGEDCVSQLFTAANFIQISNEYVDKLYADGSTAYQNREKVTQRFNRVMSDVIEKAAKEGKAVSQKENVDLIYTLVVTVSKDIVADYYHNVIDDPEEAKSGYLLAGAEDGKRIYREGIYKEVYDKLQQ